MVNELVKEFASTHGLTPRETDIVQLLAQQVVWLKDIAKTLSVSPHTVNNHFKSIFEKTKTNSRTELISLILQLAMTKFGVNPYTIRAPHVVVIDDEKDICQMLAETLGSLQMHVETFSSAREFLERLPYVRADVIISDIRMPDLDGIQLLEEIKRLNRLSPGVIFISGFAGDYEERDLMNLGAIALLDKPIDSQKLERLILEQFVENRFARKSVLKLDSKKAIPVNRIFTLGKENVGVGGISLRFDLNEELQELEALDVGGRVDLKFKLEPSNETLTATGEVVWKRFAEGASEAPSLGIKFMDVPEHSQNRLKAFVTQHKILSFIPCESEESKTVSA